MANQTIYERFAPDTQQDSVVLYADMLGVRASIESLGAQPAYDRYKAAVDASIASFEGDRESYDVHWFSDSITVAWPLKYSQDGAASEGAAWSMAIDVAHLQWTLLTSHSIPVQGGMAQGDYYTGERVDFGPALVSAYLLEQAASWPRVLVHPTLAAQDWIDPELLVRDTDGAWFIDYLGFLFRTDADAGLYSRHGDTINDMRRSAPTVAQPKYARLLEYHDWVGAEIGFLDHYDGPRFFRR